MARDISMQAQSQSRYFSNYIFSLAFAIQFLYLYSNSNSYMLEWLEVFKLLGPIVLLNIFLYFGAGVRSNILYYGFVFLCGHIAYGVVDGLLTGGVGSFISEDGRLIIPALGRGAGETAWAFAIFLVLFRFNLYVGRIAVKKYIRISVEIFAVSVILYSQSRGAVAFVAIFYGIMEKEIVIKILKSPVQLFIILVSLFLLLYFPIVQSMIDRSVSIDGFLTGRNYIWSAHFYELGKLDLSSLMFGSNLESKIVDVPEIGYVTADPHNIYIDIVNYYGIFGLLYMSFAYAVQVKSDNPFSKAVVISFLVTCCLVSPLRYPNIFYLNVLLLLVTTVEVRSPFKSRALMQDVASNTMGPNSLSAYRF